MGHVFTKLRIVKTFNHFIGVSRRGVEDAQAKIDRYKALIEKWEGLVSTDMSYEELAELRYEQIFSKIDLGSYGS